MSKTRGPTAAPTQLLTVDSCGACHWWHSPQRLAVGICKRFPPVPLVGAGCLQPTVKAEDWCGEFAQAAAEAREPVGFAAPIAREKAA